MLGFSRLKLKPEPEFSYGNFQSAWDFNKVSPIFDTADFDMLSTGVFDRGIFCTKTKRCETIGFTKVNPMRNDA